MNLKYLILPGVGYTIPNLNTSSNLTLTLTIILILILSLNPTPKITFTVHFTLPKSCPPPQAEPIYRFVKERKH